MFLFLQLARKPQIQDNLRHEIVENLNDDNNGNWLWYIMEDKGSMSNAKGSKNYEIKIAFNPEIIPNQQGITVWQKNIDN